MKIVILEHENYRGRAEKRYQIMARLNSRNGLNHVFPGQLFDLAEAIAVAKANNWEIEKIGTFYEVV